MDNLIDELVMPSSKVDSIITVIGIGHAGINAVNRMRKIGIVGVNFLICDTDRLNLDNSPVEDKVVIDYASLRRADAEPGHDPISKWLDQIRAYLENTGTRMVFIAAGMGGYTGTCASPLIAKLAREMGILTVADVTTPLKVEGSGRVDTAMGGIDALRKHADSLIVVNGERLVERYGSNATLLDIFSKADDIIVITVKSIAELYTIQNAFVRVDFSDIEQVMRDGGSCYIGVASAEGENRALEAARLSLCSPLLDSKKLIAGAKRMLINISAADADAIAYDEVLHLIEYLHDITMQKDADGNEHKTAIIWGIGSKPALGNALEVFVVATGLDELPC